ncbi:hypothetical protein MMC12_002948 [Toensbergia leucococca]|nr:hypothetical protein [Toensbergia leucococca]
MVFVTDDPMDPRSHEHRRRCYKARDETVYLHKGTPYPSWAIYLHLMHQPERGFDNMDRNKTQYAAATDLVDFLHPRNRLGSFGLDRLNANIRTPGWGPDIVVKAFHDLDKVFFQGRLEGRVTIKWKKAKFFKYDSSKGKTYGSTWSKAPRGAQIFLNADAIFLDQTSDPFKDMWGTLLHEMIHAYFDVMCGIGEGSDHHGEDFQRIFRALNIRTGPLIGVEALQ